MSEAHESDRPIGPTLWLTAGLSIACYAVLLWLGPSYALEVDCQERPLLTALALYGSASLLYLIALNAAVRRPTTRRLGAWIVGVSVLARLLMLPTPPLQEIDIYRYLWDGAVLARGEDPYALPPGKVLGRLDADNAAGANRQLDRLATIAREHTGLEEALRTIHYGWLTSPYPPVSQAVFALSDRLAPDGWSATARLRLLKGVLTLFDLATLLVLMAMLRRLRMPIGWAIAYGWCPLVIKEIAGSGHLDSIAIFLTTSALAVGLGVMDRTRSDRYREWCGVGSAALLGMGVGAKLYPVVLAPLLLAKLWRENGLRNAATAAVVGALVGTACLAPMAFHERIWPTEIAPVEVASEETAAPSLPAPPDSSPENELGASKSGLRAFLGQWEMNDLIFMIVLENLRSHQTTSEALHPWFDFTPEPLNQAALDSLRGAMARLAPAAAQASTDRQLAFQFTRALTLLLSAVIALALAWRAAGVAADEADWLRAAFLTLAWFWLLAPTQNPWYWCWVLPLLPFARGRAWFAVSAACFLYYLRFWFECHSPDPGVFGTSYDGSHFYYYVVVWLEFLPLLLWLMGEWLVRVWRSRKLP